MDDRIRDLIADFRRGYLTRRGFLAKAASLGLSSAAALALIGLSGTTAAAQQRTPAQIPAPAVQPKRWQRGRGWGWVWGEGDELGNLNELSPELAMKALSFVRRGRVYDMGLTYSRASVRWPGHAPGEIITFRSPAGVRTQEDLPFAVDPVNNSSHAAWVSTALFMSDNVATQIDSFGHFYEGDPAHAYNGFLADEITGDFGLLKLGADTIPPIVAPATLVDVAGFMGVEHLPQDFAIGPDLIQQVLAWQGVDIEPLDVVLLRYGAAGMWVKGDGVGANHADTNRVNTAGINVSAARWLVEQKGALMVGADDVDLEHGPSDFSQMEQLPDATSFNPVHNYLLVRQGVHILEFHFLEELAREKAYKFAYILGTNKIKGATAGTVQRPIGLA